LFVLLFVFEATRVSSAEHEGKHLDGSSDAATAIYPKGDDQARTLCSTCHSITDGYVEEKGQFLNQRNKLSRKAWEKKAKLQARCGICHVVPPPEVLSREGWGEAIAHMGNLMKMRRMVDFDHDQWMDIIHYYFTFAPAQEPPLSPDPRNTSVAFQSQPIGYAIGEEVKPWIGNVNIVDLDQDGHPDILVCDDNRSAVTWIRRVGDQWLEDTLASLEMPGHTATVDVDGDGDLDIVVACLGEMAPTDSLVGGVALLINDGTEHFSVKGILRGVGRLADAEPGDFDGDGDIDFSVADFGYINQGGVGWLEAKGDGTYQYHRLNNKAGAIHVPAVDINGDGRLDFIAVISQEHEEVAAYVNNGKGGFDEHILFKAVTPSFGSSGIQLVDIDGDGDMDILYSNGDNMDLPTMLVRPYHGVQVLENRGGLKFVYHDLLRYYGAYRAVAGDIDGDGDLDIVASSLFNDWSDSTRASLIWLENRGNWKFVARGIATSPTHLITAALADMDGDGRLDIVTGGMHAFPPFSHLGRITFWRNLGYAGEPWFRQR